MLAELVSLVRSFTVRRKRSFGEKDSSDFQFPVVACACGQAAQTVSVDEMVAEIIKHAAADDAAFFAQHS
jgi:hypothetical protein